MPIALVTFDPNFFKAKDTFYYLASSFGTSDIRPIPYITVFFVFAWEKYIGLIS